MITDTVQRWTERRESRRPAGELIRPADYEVAPIGSAAEARAFIERHHYAGTASSTAHRFGLYRRGALVGVALFGPPSSMAAHHKVWPALGLDEAVTLGRVVLLDEVPGNGESYFGASCFRLLRERGVVAIESCADPEPRTDERGRQVFRGHLGTIYCALNGRHVGRTRAATLRLLPDGTVLSNRAAGKLARAGEDALAWLRLWRARLTRPMRHRGCFRYVWCLDRRRRRAILEAAGPALPYPKFDGWRSAP